MLTNDENELLTQTGPGAPMGDLFRSCIHQWWGGSYNSSKYHTEKPCQAESHSGLMLKVMGSVSAWQTIFGDDAAALFKIRDLRILALKRC